MSRAVHKRLLYTIDLLMEGARAAQKLLREKRGEECLALFTDCQDLAIALGTQLEKLYGMHTQTVAELERYCEALYQEGEAISAEGELGNDRATEQKLMECLSDIKGSFEREFPNKKEVVFLPYKASMWDSLESVWKRTSEDPECEAYVVPIPYYDKNPDGSFKEFHYEGDAYPKNVPVVDYREFDLELHHPDEIYIHNPYDECNIVTSVEPAFYSKKLKEYTDKLVYIPYFVLAEPDPTSKATADSLAHFIKMPGVLYADEVIVQSEAMREVYIRVMTEFMEESGIKDKPRAYWEKKIFGTGSPKYEKLANTRREDIEIPEEWKRLIVKEDGTRKKIVFYNTSVTALLNNSEQMLTKMKDVFRVFYEYRDKITLLWRPHPLIPATIDSMCAELRTEYNRIVEQYRSEGWGIYDDTPDLDRAIVLCDAYYGDNSSVVQLCQKAGKPVMIQNADIISMEESS